MECALIEEIGSRREVDIEVEGHKIHLSSLDRVVWPKPGFAKRDLIFYYIRCSACLLRTLRDRPLSLVRYPSGIEGQRIFQRHFAKGLPDFVETAQVFSESNREAVEYLLCNNLATLIWLGQMSVIELHPWHSRITRGVDSRRLGLDYDDPKHFDKSVLNHPDYLVCDLDPNVDDRPFDRVRKVAHRIHVVLEELGLESYVKTSGKRGLHVYVPLERTHDFDLVRAFAERLGIRLRDEMPDEVTLEISLEKRPKAVFFDYSINSQAKTLACKLSPRGGPLGTVSYPVTWDQLDRITPKDFTIQNAPRLIAEKGDPWETIFEQCQKLPRAYVG